jgi:hypothetical protein
MDKKAKFCVFLLLISASFALKAQVAVGFTLEKCSKMKPFEKGVFNLPINVVSYKNPPKFLNRTKVLENLTVSTCGVFTKNNYADSLPFFCKIEHNWGKKLPMPLKFRLGSVEYVDWLEGKN